LFGQTPSQGDHKVRQYQRKNGTVVAPHYQTNPNSTLKDNYSSTGEYNPHTGKTETKTPKLKQLFTTKTTAPPSLIGNGALFILG
jgi:hypothetical protein